MRSRRIRIPSNTPIIGIPSNTTIRSRRNRRIQQVLSINNQQQQPRRSLRIRNRLLARIIANAPIRTRRDRTRKNLLKNIKGATYNFKKGIKEFYIISHMTYYNCIFTCIVHYLEFIKNQKAAIYLNNARISELGVNLKKCVKKFCKKSENYKNIDFNDLDELMPAILEYFLIKRKLKLFVEIRSLKFSVIKIFENSLHTKEHTIHIRVCNDNSKKHAQLLIPKKEIREDLMKLLKFKYDTFQPQEIIQSSEVTLIKDPISYNYYIKENDENSRMFSSISEFEQYAFDNNINIFSSRNLSFIEYAINKPPRKKKFVYEKNVDNFFGFYDIECFSNGGIQIPFAIKLVYKFRSPLNNKVLINDVVFWGTTCINEFFDFIRDNKNIFKDIILYAHNQRKYVGFLLVKFLIYYPDVKIISKNMLINNGGFIKFSAKFKNSFKVDFNCSYSLLPFSLKFLGDGFNVEHKKLDFDIEEYAKKWFDYKDEILKYLHNDTYCGFEIMEKLQEFYESEGVKLKDMCTGPSAAVSIFMKNFWNAAHKLPILKEPYERIVKNTYLGGRVECNKIGVITSNKSENN